MLVMLVMLVMGCPSRPSSVGPGAVGSPPDSSTGSRVLPLTWADLAPHRTAVYAGRLLYNAPVIADGDPEWCEAPERRVEGAGAAVPAPWCDPGQAPIGHGWEAPPGAPAWILTRTIGGREEPWVVAPCDGACATPPHDAFTFTVACSELEAINHALPSAGSVDEACATAADCVALTAMCFDGTVNAAHAARYRAALDAHWSAHCLGPGAGMCPPAERTVACVAGYCRLQP